MLQRNKCVTQRGERGFMPTRDNSWLSLPFKAWRLALESQTVVGLRMMRLSGGGLAAAAEAELMVTEKAWTAWQAQSLLTQNTLSGHPHRGADLTLDLYRRKVRANRRRLSKPL
jgi:hypothetical protein